MFDKKVWLSLQVMMQMRSELLLEADVEVDDVEAEDGTITVYTAPTDLHKAIVALKESGIQEFNVTELEMIPQSEVSLEGDDLATFENSTMPSKTMKTSKNLHKCRCFNIKSASSTFYIKRLRLNCR